MKNKFGVLRNNLFMLKYILKYVPGLIVYNLILKIVTGITGTITNVYMAKYILDSVQIGRSVIQVMLFFGMIFAANIAVSLGEAYYTEVFYLKRKEILSRKMYLDLFEKSKKMELACYDNPEFYNDFVWATSQADDKALSVLTTTGEFIEYLTKVISIIGIIISINWVGIIVVGISSLISFMLRLKMNKKEYELAVEQRPLQRKRDYTNRILYLADYAKEIRLSNVKQKLINEFSKTNNMLIETIRTYGKKMIMFEALNRFLVQAQLLNIIYILYLVFMITVKKTITYGGFIGLYQGTDSLRENLIELGGIFSDFQNYSLYIEKFKVFLNYKPKLIEDLNPEILIQKPLVLELNHVSFTYDGAKTPTINDISLKIEAGEKIALVGYNGAGKTTLIKLIMRLYDVNKGSILINGINLKKYRLKDLRNYFGVVFQDFKLFSATISENVIMDIVKKDDEQKVQLALKNCDFTTKLNSLEEGTDTVLTREFSEKGVNLSGGESQKLAIARVYARDCNIIILDEPSSALDPVTEFNVNKSMIKLAKDKTVIFISHRLSTTRDADRIIMLEHGSIIEEGSHEELMKLKGKYAEMFNMQAEKYKGEQIS